MIDIRKLRENPEHFRKAASDKGVDPQIVDELIEVDRRRRELLRQAEVARSQTNAKSKEIGPRISAAKKVYMSLAEAGATAANQIGTLEPSGESAVQAAFQAQQLPLLRDAFATYVGLAADASGRPSTM
ncbi:MAG: hypothetical protein U0636_02460 [Phycisphaerales bacterium]